MRGELSYQLHPQLKLPTVSQPTPTLPGGETNKVTNLHKQHIDPKQLPKLPHSFYSNNSTCYKIKNTKKKKQKKKSHYEQPEYVTIGLRFPFNIDEVSISTSM
jgi:hypothetical protein